ncbi:hypothetical protein [Streptomyces sp. NPDC059378]|uniref:hypothetical protein n=1 Tax=Streptomyces sp. NPDC059378 TaxID=3346815 RepID=UPI00369F9252
MTTKTATAANVVTGPTRQHISSTPIGLEQHGEGGHEGLGVVTVHRIRWSAQARRRYPHGT